MKKTAAYQKIYQDLSQGILTGKWQEGDLLPTEAAVAQSYGVSRITSRQAFAMLADGGYIIRVQGKGSVVASAPSRQPLLGLVLSDFDSLFGTEFVKGVFHEAASRGYLVLMQTGYHVREQEGECLRRLLTAGVQGVIDVPLYDSMHYTEELQAVSERIPLIFADRRVVGLEAPLVCTDNVGGTEFLCRKLHSNGYQSIAFISSKTDSTAVGERLKGYLNDCTAGGRVPDKRLMLTSIRSTLPGMGGKDNEAYDIGQIERFLTENQNVRAVIAHTYQVAKLVHRAANNLGLRVPQDCAIVCFDAPRADGEAETYAHMRQNEYEMGARAVQRLTDTIAGKQTPDITYVDAVFVDGKSYVHKHWEEAI
mgnify:CR=1 FL=1